MNHWTKNEPKEPGFYWMLSGGKANVVEIIERSGRLCVKYGTFMVGAAYFDKAEWHGPLPVPTHQKEETVLLRDADHFERFAEAAEDTVAFYTASMRCFIYTHERTAQGLRIFSETKA